MPIDLVIFMRQIGLLEAVKAAPAPRREPTKGEWFKGMEVPF